MHQAHGPVFVQQGLTLVSVSKPLHYYIKKELSKLSSFFMLISVTYLAPYKCTEI